MIDIEIKELDKNDLIEFPCLMIAKNGTIIIATSIDRNRGFVTGRKFQKSSYFGKVDKYDLNLFKKFNGEIIIKNK